MRPPRRQSNGSAGSATPIICGIYCRKSVDETNGNGAFNSTDAQRDACLNYIAAQKDQGWVAHRETFVDSGISGGTLERPALRRLLAEVEAGHIQVVIVYRADRLSRRILDFLQLVEKFDKHNVAFVSVTEQFNTSTPGGRLYQHMLLSFAEYERALIGERTRHKAQAARRKGRFTGGALVLGYDRAPEGGRLVVKQTEAERVRTIFKMFIENPSIIGVVEELDRRGWRLKKWVTKTGREWGGGSFDKFSLKRLLTNHLYIGKVLFDGTVYDGEQEAIVDQADWDAVQGLLGDGGPPRSRSSRNPSLLAGLLRCEPCQAAMSPCYSQRGNRRWPYYRCQQAYRRGHASCPSKQIPAREVEQFVVDKIRAIGRDPELVAATVEQARGQLAIRRRELDSEIRDIQRMLDSAHVAARTRIAAAGNGKRSPGPDCAPEADVVALENRLAALREEQAALHGLRIQRDDLEAALGAFDPIFDALTTAEQQRVVRLLIQEIDYDGGTGSLKITFAPAGVRALAAEGAR